MGFLEEELANRVVPSIAKKGGGAGKISGGLRGFGEEALSKRVS